MSLKWGVGHFRNGNISTWLESTNAKLTFDIDDSATTAEVALPLSKLTTSQRDRWREIFRPGIKFMALCELDDDTDEILKVRFAGFINKTSNPIGDGVLTIQLTSPSEYMKTRFVIDSWTGTITDPTSSKTFEAASWRGVMSEIIRECFDASGIPSSIPKPPQILGSRPSDTGTGRKIKVEKSEVKSYYDLLSEVSEESGVGQEWKFVPVPDDTAVDKIQWNVVLGTNATPQINRDETYSMTLDASTKLSAYGKTIDSSTFFTTLWLQSKTGDTEKKEGMDLQQQSVPYNTTENAVLFEKYESLGVELEQGEMNAQFSSRMLDAGKLGNEVEITLEEVANPYVWVSRLGAMLSVVGIDGTSSAGFSDSVRITNVSFELGVGTVVLGVQEPQVRYRKLPKQKVGSIAGSPTQNSKPLNTSKPPAGGGGGAPIPPQPWEPGNPENPGDGGAGAAWGLNAGYEIGTEPVYNDNKVVGTKISTNVTLPWGNPQPTDNQVIIQNESNILHFIQNFGPLPQRNYTFAEAPTFPVGLGLGQQSPTAFWSAFMQEGIIKSPTQLANRNVLTDANLNLAFQNAGEKSLWSRPPAVEIPPGINPLTHPGNISYFYVQQITITPMARFSASIGGKIIIPITFKIKWGRDNANSSGSAPTGWGGYSLDQEFTTFFEASYSGLSEIGEFSHKTDFILSGSLLYASGRAGSFYLFKKTGVPLIVWSLNMGATSGLDENCFISPPLPADTDTFNHFIHFGDFWNENLCLIGGIKGSGWGVGKWGFYYYKIPSGKTAPVFDEGGQWQEAMQLTGADGNKNTQVSISISSSWLTAFDGKPIISRKGQYYHGAHILDGVSNASIISEIYNQQESIAAIFCYRNFVYIISGGGYNRYHSARIDYQP